MKANRLSRILLTLTIAASAVSANSANAAIIEFSYSGIFNEGYYADRAFSGTLRYDDAAEPLPLIQKNVTVFNSVGANLSIDGIGSFAAGPTEQSIILIEPNSQFSQVGIRSWFKDEGITVVLSFLDYTRSVVDGSRTLPAAQDINAIKYRTATASTAGVGSNGSLSSRARTFTSSVSVVSPVPEPRTWALMILGFGVVGYSMRRKTVLRFV